MQAIVRSALCLAVGVAGLGSSQVTLSSKNHPMCTQTFETYFWILHSDLARVGMPTDKVCSGACGSVSINGGSFLGLNQINIHDGSDVCRTCNGCPLAYIQLSPGQQLPNGLVAGALVNLTYTRGPAPPPPPSPPSPAPPPAPTPAVHFVAGGLYVELAEGTLAATTLNVSINGSFAKENNFSFVGGVNVKARTGCPLLGDMSVRVAPVGVDARGRGSGGTAWATYDSAFAATSSYSGVTNATHGSPMVLAAHDITALLNSSSTATGYNQTLFPTVPLRVVRSWESTADGHSLVLRFTLTNTWTSDLVLGGLGFAMPQAGMQHGIEESVWNDPHVGLDHGFVEWARVVVDERTLLATPEGTGTGLEGWRPLLGTCSSDDWSWEVFTEAWAEEWRENKQFPFLEMPEFLATAVSSLDNTTLIWPKPHQSPWPAWHGHETIPVTDWEGVAAPWNPPTSGVLKAGESRAFAVRLTLADKGPRTRNAALAKIGRAVLQAVPGYVVSPDMDNATLYVTSPAGASLASVAVSDASIMSATVTHRTAPNGATAVAVEGLSRGRCRLNLHFNDGSVATAHYNVLPSLTSQVVAVGKHWAEDAWLPRDYPDPFGRSASVMPWDRHDKTWVLDDSRAYDVGLSDDAGGGNPLGFAIKTAYMPTQDHVTRLDDYVKWTLYGIKPDTAKPPFKSLQIRPEDCDPALGNQNGSQCGNEDGIRMTMYYYYSYTDHNYTWSGHFDYEYKEADKIKAPGIEGGPNWPMTESSSNATYRAFNFPHHVTTYLALYYAARNTNLKTYQSWDWYLMRAANTTLKFGAPSVGVMDDTTFREILTALAQESKANPQRIDFFNATRDITANMLQRATTFAEEMYPYGSEFAFDTTGQEAVVVWLLYFANETNGFAAAAKRTVDHILSYMRSSPTWPYNGGTRSWGDLGNNGKWMATSGTNFETRGNMHYRSGLNAIPLLEWFKRNPDDTFLLEPALGAVAGQMGSIDENGAPSMMLHMEPHILDYDPHSGDYGLGFFGCSINSAAYYVEHPELGQTCYLCNVVADSQAGVAIQPRDLYRRRVYLEPLGVYLQLFSGSINTVVYDATKKTITLIFRDTIQDGYAYSVRRLQIEKMAASRPGSAFVTDFPLVRGAYEIPASSQDVVIKYM